MTDYGQGITPRWYREQSAKRLTKSGFAHIMYRALVRVGMVPISVLNPYNAGASANAEFVVTTSRNDLRWFFDFPTSESWVINGIPYRPVLCMYSGSQASSTGPGAAGTVGSSFFFHLFYRRADRVAIDDLWNRTRLHSNTYATTLGLGSSADPHGIGSAAMTPADQQEGCAIHLNTWKHYEGSADATRPDYLNFKNLHIILGKGGLTVQVGTGTGKTDSNDLFSFTIVFGGARIPGRARIPASDPNLNKTCPVFMFPHLTTNVNPGAFYAASEAVEGVSLSGVHPVTWLLGAQHDLKVSVGSSTAAAAKPVPGAVRAALFNLENIERPLYPILASDTKTSPRVLVSGGAHVLQPIVYANQYAYQNSLDYYGPLDPTIRSESTPPWFDVWFVPKFRFGDRTAPFGEYVDPTSGLNWFVFRSAGVNHMVATEVEGITKYIDAPVTVDPVFVLGTDHYYNLNGGFTWTAGNPYPAVAVTTSSGGFTWVPTASTDEALFSESGAAAQTNTLTFTSDPYFPAVDTQFRIRMELFWRSASAQANSTSNPMFLEYSPDGSTWITLETIYNTGVTAGPYQNYTQTQEYVVVPSPTDQRIRFRLRNVAATTAGGTRSAGIRQIRVRQYTY